MKIKKTIICVILLLAMSVPAGAQRMMENLSRGLVAVKTTGGVYLSWRLLGQEWYDVTYNVYRDGVRVNSEPLVTSNYQDAVNTGDYFICHWVIECFCEFPLRGWGDYP